MALNLENLRLGYSKLLEWTDPRVKKWPLMGSPIPTFVIFFAYLFFVLEVGPSIMKNREAYDLSKTIQRYNLVQVVFNIIGVFLCLPFVSIANVFCMPDNHYLVIFHYLYYLLKILDLVDTIFFVLRKKFKQVTFLHLYHHGVMLVGTWMLGNYSPGSQMYFLGVINAFVHSVMYYYYYLTSCDSKYKTLIWMKKRLTQLQITQHCIVFVTLLLPLLNSNCGYPKGFLVLTLIANILMNYLFIQFYINTYIKRKETMKQKADS